MPFWLKCLLLVLVLAPRLSMQCNVLGLLPRLIMLDWTAILDALVGLEAVGLCEGKFGKHGWSFMKRKR